MARIRLLAVENSLSLKRHDSQQTLVFWLAVENLGYGKQVDVVWAGENGVWHELRAHYRGNCGDGREYWQARITLSGRSGRMLPGRVRFALRLRCAVGEFWDNNQGRDYISRSASGVELVDGLPVRSLDIKRELRDGQQWLPVRVAVSPELSADSVTIHWTTDNWRTTRQTPCHRAKLRRVAGAEIWNSRLKVGEAFRLQYCVCCETRELSIWDNNGGGNYRLSRPPLTVMILNLHCYQEDRQDFKFGQIAKAIDEQAADVVCLQEVAEYWNHGHGDWTSNAANIINQRLKAPMHLYTDWSHLGFDQYREGVAILSRYPLHHAQSRYVSDSHDVYSIHSRKVVMAQVQVPYIGAINVFSAHLSWWEDGFSEQFRRLGEWAASLGQSVKATLLCGDFNIAAGSIGYRQVVSDGHFEDQYLAVNRRGLFEQIFRVNDPHWQNCLADDYRIDYIFMNKGADLAATSARVLFTDDDEYGRVSDHCGYLLTFEPK